MPHVTEDYVQDLAEIYQDIFRTYRQLDPARKKGYGLAIQSLYSVLSEKYDLAQIQEACNQLALGGAVEIKNGIFAHPTDLGEEIIAKLTEGHVPPPAVPPFNPPAGN